MKNITKSIFLLLMLLFVSLSGCEEKNNGNGNHTTNTTNGNQTGNTTNGDTQHNTTGNAFLGLWQVTDTTSINETWTFYANHSAKNYLIQEFEDEQLTSESWFTYIYDETTLCFTTDADPDSRDYFSICYSYTFFENTTRLTFSYNSIVIMNLQKQLPA